ncbi:ABC transporter ATP-binding protein [Sciscionella sediminilitoris]|uniref:ABC transporter ATP-binding protein n=1 Tax=Sciscionella sediminilitoris TaxID=1445613 RepID=UPI0005639D7E|nr:ABC transporter ATP-binding protein [Sciscionella sp. SE31]
MSTPLLETHELSVHLNGSITPVEQVSLRIEPGSALGIVGESGSGKSLTMRALLGVLPEHGGTSGRVELANAAGGRPCRTAMIFQEPLAALNPTMRVGRLIAEGARAGGATSRGEARARALELMTQVGIPEPERRFHMWPHELSGGLRQRVMIATALSGDPDLLLCDEPTTALDMTVQAQILQLLGELRGQRGMALVFVSHDLGVVARVCERLAVMYAGRIVETGPTEQVLSRPKHPYTAALLGSAPAFDRREDTLTPIPGSPPPPHAFPAGCRFRARCAFARPECAWAEHMMRGPIDAQTACILPFATEGRFS